MAKNVYTCVVCPVSCTIEVIPNADGGFTTEGNQCKRGEKYAISEHTDPVRMVTTTVKIRNAILPRLPVISEGEVPKGKLKECLNDLYQISVEAPVRCGDIIVKNICGTGVNILAARTMKEKN